MVLRGYAKGLFWPFDLAGVFMAIFRLLEPYVLRTLIDEINTCSMKTLGKESFASSVNQKFENEALSSFANSRMNVEYVYIIL